MTINENTSKLLERQLVTFYLGSDEFGADIMNVKEIVRVLEITKVPNAPAFIEGVCNLRGNVLPIIDGRTRLNMERKERDENSRVIVIDINGKATGIIVDKVSEVIRISGTDIEKPPEILKNIDANYLDGIAKLKNGNRLIMLLNLTKILEIEEIVELKEHIKEIRPGQSTSGNISKEQIEEEHLVSFKLGKEEYAIHIMQVKEIIRVPDIVKVPNVERYIEGVVSIRNHLLPILNLRTYFGMPYKEVNDRTRILVVDIGKVTTGIMVDKVSEVMRIPKDMIQPPPSIFKLSEEEQLKGVAKLNQGKRLILLLEPEKLVPIEKLKSIENIGETSETEGIQQDEEQQMEEDQLVTFKLGQEEFGIRIVDVQEINRMTEISKVPRAPRFIEGVVNLRGNVIPVLDLRERFSMDKTVQTDTTRIIIVDILNKKTGIIVDAVAEVLRFEKKLVESPPEILSSSVDTEFIDGVGKLDNGRRLILILDLEKVLYF